MSDTIRRGQLIAPFGVGGLSVLKNSEAVVTAGLDAWFDREDVDRDEFEVHEPRLAKTLGVRALYMPPEYRRPWLRYAKSERRNLELTVPFALLPRWHFCPACRRMVELSPHHQLTGRGHPCEHCTNRPPRVKQVRFLAMCESGHIQDFPWREWVHRNVSPDCDGTLQLRVHSGASLNAIRISCEGCGAKRDLGGVMTAHQDHTTDLSRKLQPKAVYRCQGLQPWLGGTREPCGNDIRATLRSATNLHFARIRSSLFLPPETLSFPIKALVDELTGLKESNPGFRTVDDTLKASGNEDARVESALLTLRYKGNSDWTAQQVQSALTQLDADDEHGDTEEKEWSESEFRHQEFEVIRNQTDSRELKVEQIEASKYSGQLLNGPMSGYIASVSLLHKVRETRAFYGFSRVRSDESLSVLDSRKQLSRAPCDWLPASVVRGEGVFLELRPELLQQWEQSADATDRLGRMAKTFSDLQRMGRLPVHAEFSPRFVLLHSLAHSLITRLVFDAGYGAASLRERVFSSRAPDTQMAGILIYTAAGDSEGTLGGLVEMGRPGRLEGVLRRSLEAAKWCSLDPVCSEIGKSHGQGPDGCNEAACHSCALLPETSCEHFNRFLDRAVLVGSPTDRTGGFFTS